MAERRMISIAFCEADDFIFLASSQKSLYFQLMLHADDDGYVRGARGIMRLDGDSQDDLDALVAAGFLLKFPSGVVLVRHWRWHNQVRRDVYKPTVCVEEAAMVAVDDNDVYYMVSPDTELKTETSTRKPESTEQETESAIRKAAETTSERQFRILNGGAKGSFDTDAFFAAALRRTYADTGGVKSG